MHKLLTSKQIGDSKVRLLKERDELEVLGKETIHADGERFDLKVEAPENSDESINVGALETNIVLKEHMLEGIARIDSALERIENGGYGICIDCDTDIPYERLMAFPAAARCLTCKEKFEAQN